MQVLTDDGEVDNLSEHFQSLVADAARRVDLPEPKLVVVRSQYRTLFEPLLEFLEQVASTEPERQIAVVIPELVERRWYQFLLHRQSASVLKALLVLRGSPELVVVSVPWYLRDWRPERTWLSRFRWPTRKLGHSRRA